MPETDSRPDNSIDERLGQGLKHLTVQNILMIDEAIDSVGEFGEVHLIVNKGRLRFVELKTSLDALKYNPSGSEDDSSS